MNSKLKTKAGIFNPGNLAFVIVVCASYASAVTAMIYGGHPISPREGVVVALEGLGYLILGTYGFTICRRSGSLLAAGAYFTIQILIAVSLIVQRGSAGELSLILLPLAGQTALLLPLSAMIPVCFAIYLTLVTPLLIHSRWIDAVAIALVYGTGIVFVVVFTRVAADERKARSELSEANAQLRENAKQIEELAITKERNRLAREIHDGLGHYLTVVNIQIEAARAIFATDQGRAMDHLGKAQSLTQDGLAEVRRSVATLRATPADGRPLTEALTVLVDQWNAAGIHVDFKVSGTIRTLTPQAELTLYRTAQEALTNVGKHANGADSASEIKVKLSLDFNIDDRVRMKIQDDGEGALNSEGGFGLLGVRERAHLLGGEIDIITSPGQGFTLEVELPE